METTEKLWQLAHKLENLGISTGYEIHAEVEHMQKWLQETIAENDALRQQLAEQTSSEPDELLDMPFVTDEQKFRFWQAAKKEVKALRHDIDSYMTIANEYANSNQSVEVLVEALRDIAEGKVHKAGKIDSCEHGRYGYEGCDTCIEEYAESVLATYSKPITVEDM